MLLAQLTGAAHPAPGVDDSFKRLWIVWSVTCTCAASAGDKAYYWRKYHEVAKYQHKRALVLTARKLVRLVHALLTKNVSYVRLQSLVYLQEDAVLQ